MRRHRSGRTPNIVDVTSASIPFRRDEMLSRLASESFDVLVIGGGITGVGVALDAATRGLRTALVERDDFASGTSSKSSKMIHGGLRYLQNGDVRLVYEALHERQRLLRNAPHLVSVLPFLIPILTKDGPVSRKIAKALGSALWMYDLTGGWRIGRRHRRLDAAAAARHAPLMDPDRLAGGFVYFDAAADDARLTLAVARTAADHGAVVANRCAVVGLTRGDDGRSDGAEVDIGSERIRVRAETIVNAAGVWADEVRGLDEGGPPQSLRPARGVHVTIPWEKVRVDVAVVIPVPGDKRSLFVVPWIDEGDGTFRFAYVGTTDTDHEDGLDDPQCTGDDLDYVLRALNRAFTSTITIDDVTAVWSGLRPLVRGDTTASASPTSSSPRTADLSRTHQVAVSESGVIRIVGGKLTTYRSMAADTVDEVLRRRGFSPRRRRSRTARLRLHGGDGFRPSEHGDALTRHLERRYGTDAAAVRALIDEARELAEPLIPGLPYVRAEAVFAARHEMATTLADVLERRTRAHLLDRDASERAAPEVAALLAAELGWDPTETDTQVHEYRRICERERRAADTRAELRS